MKRIVLSAILCATVAGSYAQEEVKEDSTKVKAKVYVKVGDWEYGAKKDSVKRLREAKVYPQFSFGLTFSRFDLGLNKLLDNGSMGLSPENSYLSYRAIKSTNVGFDLLQMGVRFNPNFKVFLAAGLDWNIIRLKRNITFQKDKPLDQYVEETINFEKNRLSSRYLRVPLSFQFRSNEDNKGNRIYFAAGPELGFLLNGKLKQKSKENGKQKFINDYNFEPLRYGAFARFGYGWMGIYAKYYFNDVFTQLPGNPDNLKNFSFGLTIGF
ncbi:MAG: outer membrane beta-barrel protein [Daejeonella sp.]